MTIAKQAILVSLSITQWSARRIDKKVTKEVHSQHNASDKAGRYNKCLIDVQADSFVAVSKIDGEARQLHATQTLPWLQNGARILLGKNYEEYVSGMSPLERSFNDAVEVFLADYPRLKEQARHDLNGMFNPDDYPSERELRRKYSFETRFLPVPSGDDFRVSISETEMQKIRSQVEVDVQNATNMAMRDLWERLYKPVRHMADTLSKSEPRIFDSLVGNVQEICDLLPRLNLTGDQHLDALRNEIIGSLGNVSPQDLRTMPSARSEIAVKADEIARRMAALMS